MIVQYKALRFRDNDDMFLKTIPGEESLRFRAVNLADGTAGGIDLYPRGLTDEAVLAKLGDVENFDPSRWEIVTLEIAV